VEVRTKQNKVMKVKWELLGNWKGRGQKRREEEG
jgi:hypothetical protein